jgi:hypothetical protein
MSMADQAPPFTSTKKDMVHAQAKVSKSHINTGALSQSRPHPSLALSFGIFSSQEMIRIHIVPSSESNNVSKRA